jgi:hypothetical protein
MVFMCVVPFIYIGKCLEAEHSFRQEKQYLVLIFSNSGKFCYQDQYRGQFELEYFID